MREFTVIRLGSDVYLHYWCKHCTEECINDLTAVRSRHRECADCHSLPVLDRGKPVDRILPSLRWASVYVESVGATASEERSGRDPHGGPEASTGAHAADRREAANDDAVDEFVGWRGAYAPDGGEFDG